MFNVKIVKQTKQRIYHIEQNKIKLFQHKILLLN